MIEVTIMLFPPRGHVASYGRCWTRLSTETGAGSLQVGSTRPRRRYRHDYCAVGATRVLQAAEQRPQCWLPPRHHDVHPQL
jgi:hypothetical protein